MTVKRPGSSRPSLIRYRATRAARAEDSSQLVKFGGADGEVIGMPDHLHLVIVFGDDGSEFCQEFLHLRPEIGFTEIEQHGAPDTDLDRLSISEDNIYVVEIGLGDQFFALPKNLFCRHGCAPLPPS